MILHPERLTSQFAVLALLALVPLSSGALEAVVDVNGDGLLIADPRQGAPLDRATAEQPFVFWLNRDQDDSDEPGETWPIERADGDTPEIDSIRDLEDFARLRIDLVAEERRTARGPLVLRWLGDAPPRINLYRAVDPGCSRAHILDRATAERQRAAPYGTRLGVLDDAPLEISLPPQAGDSLCLLFDAARGGSGELEVSLSTTLGQASTARVPMELRHVKTFFERRAADWPADIDAPWRYVDQAPPVPDVDPYVDHQGYPYVPFWGESDEIIVWVYGWLRSGEGLDEMATTQAGETVFKRLWHRGFRGRLLCFRWPTVKPRLSYGLLGKL